MVTFAASGASPSVATPTLFGDVEFMDLPERANEALDNLGKIYAMTRGHRLEFTLAGGDGPDYPGEFVGDSNHGLVVSPRAVDLPLGEEHTEVGVATLGDASEAANVATGVFLGN